MDWGKITGTQGRNVRRGVAQKPSRATRAVRRAPPRQRTAADNTPAAYGSNNHELAAQLFGDDADLFGEDSDHEERDRSLDAEYEITGEETESNNDHRPSVTEDDLFADETDEQYAAGLSVYSLQHQGPASPRDALTRSPPVRFGMPSLGPPPPPPVPRSRARIVSISNRPANRQAAPPKATVSQKKRLREFADLTGDSDDEEVEFKEISEDEGRRLMGLPIKKKMSMDLTNIKDDESQQPAKRRRIVRGQPSDDEDEEL